MQMNAFTSYRIQMTSLNLSNAPTFTGSIQRKSLKCTFFLISWSHCIPFTQGTKPFSSTVTFKSLIFTSANKTPGELIIEQQFHNAFVIAIQWLGFEICICNLNSVEWQFETVKLSTHSIDTRREINSSRTLRTLLPLLLRSFVFPCDPVIYTRICTAIRMT